LSIPAPGEADLADAAAAAAAAKAAEKAAAGAKTTALQDTGGRKQRKGKERKGRP
jgi:hypothetical protein